MIFFRQSLKMFQNVKFNFNIFLFVGAFLFQFSFSASVLKDQTSQFIYRDSVLNYSVQSCKTGGYKLSPEQVRFIDDSALPYRIYRVALPDSTPPRVEIKEIQSKQMSFPWCQEDSLSSPKLQVGVPFFKDGLWLTDIAVPLLLYPKFREIFEVVVHFKKTNHRGQRPGKRVLSTVLNPKSASKWARKHNGSVLRKKAASKMASMEWVARFAVGDKEISSLNEDGLYAVPFSEIKNVLMAAGVPDNFSGVPISKWKLYGAIADTLSDVFQDIEEVFPNKLFEIPIEIRDHNGRDPKSNGIFDDGDTLIFVGYGTSIWKKMSDSVSAPYYFSNSPYSYFQYFQLGWSNSPATKNLKPFSVSKSTNAKEINWLHYTRVEKESILRDTYFGKPLFWESATGKEWFWYWHSFNDTLELSSSDLYSPSTSELKSYKKGTEAYVSYSYLPHRSTIISKVGDLKQVVNPSYSGYHDSQRMEKINFNAELNGVPLVDPILLPGGNFYFKTNQLNEKDNKFSLKMLPNEGYFDRFKGYSLAYEWEPKTDCTEWLLPGTHLGLLKIPVPSKNKIIKFKNGEALGVLESKNGFAIDSIGKGEDVRYLLYKEGHFKTDLQIEAIIPRQKGVLENLEAISSKTEYLIIAPEAFQVPALELASFRASGESIQSIPTTIVLAEDIYRLYNGGSLDPIAIRNYIAYARSVCPHLKYVLLGGSGHYDYRRINSKLPEIHLPPFEKEAMATDDFFAVLDPGESITYGTYDLDVIVGRLSISSVAAFHAYNEKVKEYEKIGVFDNGPWRSTLILAADDALNSGSIDYTNHTKIHEEIAKEINQKAKLKRTRFDYKKVYLLDYKPDALFQKPEAASDLIDNINQGALFTLYFGHGSITDWASEGLMKPSYIDKISNQNRYTILGSFSCTVGRCDNGDETSLSVVFLVACKKGSFASVGATRETFASYNEVFAKTFIMSSLFNESALLGDAYWAAKGYHRGSYSRQRYNSEHYALLGEPVLTIPQAKLKVELNEKIDTIMALDKMQVSGTVSDMPNGRIYVSVREGDYTKKIYDGIEDWFDVVYSGNPIYSEIIEVKRGQFNTEFITPRKIAFGDTNAQVYAWAYSAENPFVGTALIDGIKVSGTSAYADSIQDQSPPSIQIRSCLKSSSTGIMDGGKIQLELPACLEVVVEDSAAMDFIEEADEGISFEVVGVMTPFHPWPFLEQSSKKVVSRMSFSETDFSPGVYEFKVQAYDVMGNRAFKSVFVELTNALTKGLMDVFNAPNPMKKTTTFHFKNLAVERETKINIYIYNQNGRLVQVLKNAKSGKTTWDGRDFYGRLLANGLYHYSVKNDVSATEFHSKQVFSAKQKLVISR